MPPSSRRLPQTLGRCRLRLAGATTVSLLVHALILSLQFGAPGIGLPSLDLSWHERRAQSIDLRVVLAPPAVQPEAEPPSSAIASPVASPPSTGLRLVPMPAKPAPKARKKRGTEKTPASPRPPRARVKRETPVIALNDARDSRFNMPAPAVDEVLPAPQAEAEAMPPVPIPEPAAVPEENAATAHEDPMAAQRLAEQEQQRMREAEEREARLQVEARAAEQARAEAERRQEEESRERTLALEAQRREEAERLARETEERTKAEEEGQRAAALALQRQQEEILRREREDAARRALELEEKQRVEAQRLQAERMQREAMELQARKQAEAAAEAARQQAAARERARQSEELAARRKADAEAEAVRAHAPRRDPELVLGDSPAPGARIDPLSRGLAGGGLAGRALDQARRGDALRNDGPSLRQSDTPGERPRRHSILGKDVDVGVMMYVESWRLKIERNGSIMYSRAAAEKAHGDAVVTVSVRSDGSVEEVVIHRSSGRPELDEAVHRIVRVNARYSAFPPELARRFDVIEIRKVWNFDDRLRILEEVR